MIVVLSGEGPSDIGSCRNQQSLCSIPEFSIGPMTVLIDDLIQEVYGYSPLSSTPHTYRYCSERSLSDRAKARPRGFALAGKKRGVETGFFYINAWMLGELAQEIESIEGDESLAVLFRDADGTNSSPRDLWGKKLSSIQAGFLRAQYANGIPMLPRPKSEAWLLCALKDPAYQNCRLLEEISGNDSAPISAKGMLENCFNNPTASRLSDWLQQNDFNQQVVAEQMPSFSSFRERMIEVLHSLRR